MKAFAQHPCFRLMVMALVAWAVVWGTSSSAGAQENPSHSPDVSLSELESIEWITADEANLRARDTVSRPEDVMSSMRTTWIGEIHHRLQAH